MPCMTLMRHTWSTAMACCLHHKGRVCQARRAQPSINMCNINIPNQGLARVFLMAMGSRCKLNLGQSDFMLLMVHILQLTIWHIWQC